jgi:hypothetical protein
MSSSRFCLTETFQAWTSGHAAIEPRIDALRWSSKKQNGYGGTALASGVTHAKSTAVLIKLHCMWHDGEVASDVIRANRHYGGDNKIRLGN